MKPKRRNRALQLGAAVLLALLLGGAITLRQATIARATLWTLAEVALSLVIASGIALFAVSTNGPRMQPFLAQLASRGIELVAALPLVLVGALLAVAAHAPLPIAIAITIGILIGLRCMRTVAVAPLTLYHDADPRRLPVSRRLEATRVLLSQACRSVVEDVIGLEAAIAWLGLLDMAPKGGLGEQIGIAARIGQLGPLLGWTGLAICVAVALKLVAWAGVVNPGSEA
jgi:hypothetical protein